jgi:hypothetical protein
MTDIKNFSSVAASNNLSPPDGFPEGQAASSYNNSARELMAAIRRQHEQAEWIDFGDVPTYISTTSFSVPNNRTSFYQVGRRIRISDSSTLYGTITASVFTSLTTVTVALDSGSISVSISAVAAGLASVINKSIPLAAVLQPNVQSFNAAATVASAGTTNLGAATSNLIDISGSTTITSFGSTATDGQVFQVRFTGAPLLTYNATSLILPGAANIQAAAGDTAIFRALGGGNFVCETYQKASVAPVSSAVYNGGTSGGTANAHTLTLPGFSVATGATVVFVPGNSNSGATTININGSGAVNVVKSSFITATTACAGAELLSGVPCVLVYNGSNYVIQNPNIQNYGWFNYQGLIIQWGSGSVAPNTTSTFNFATTFPTTVLTCVVGLGITTNTASNMGDSTGGGSISTSQYQVRQGLGTGANRPFQMIAIGY